MPVVTFYLLHPSQSADGLAVQEALVCDLAGSLWSQDQRVLIACESQEQAHRLDEALWQRPLHRFVPHALAGENFCHSAPIEIYWPTQPFRSGRTLLISLMPYWVEFASRFTRVIDFVPPDPELKQLARQRYQAYRQAGFQLTTAEPPPSLTDDDHGKNLQPTND
jgi:DNA polymerase-3 subunit chi